MDLTIRETKYRMKLISPKYKRCNVASPWM